MQYLTVIILFAVSSIIVTVNGAALIQPDSLLYTNTWAVEVHGGAQVADEVAQRHGMINMGRV